MKTSKSILAAMLLVSLAVHGLTYGQGLHGVGLQKAAEGPLYYGDYYYSAYRITNNQDDFEDTLEVTVVRDTLQSHTYGDLTTGNLLTDPDVHDLWTFTDGGHGPAHWEGNHIVMPYLSSATALHVQFKVSGSPYQVTWDDVAAGYVDDVYTITVEDRCNGEGSIESGCSTLPNDASWSARAVCICPEPGIEIKKYVSVDGGVTWEDADTAPYPSVPVGGDVKFKVRVCNTGDVPLANIAVDDTHHIFTVQATSLLPGECDESDVITVTALEGEQCDLAYVIGTPICPVGALDVTDDDPACYTGVPAAIDIEKYVSVDGGSTWDDADSAPGPSAIVGDPVWFKVMVCNTGGVPLSNIVVGDTDFTFAGVATSLNPGECDESDVYVVPGGAVLGQQDDLASVTGTPPVGDPVTDEDPAYYTGTPPPPAIDIEKYVSVDGGTTWHDADSAPGPSAAVGSDVMFKVIVCNTGGYPLTGIVVTDTDFTFAGVATSLNPGECDESDVYVVPGGAVLGQQDDLATVVGTPPVGDDVSDEDPAYYRGESTFCSVTQGFWGNAGGTKCGLTTTELLNALLDSDPVVVGVAGRSIRFDSAAAVILRLPAGGSAAALPAGFGDKNATSLPTSILMKNKPEIKNVLVGQVVTLALNLRLSDLPCTEDMGVLGDWELPEEFCTPGADGLPVRYTIPAALVGLTVGDLLELANLALGGEDVSPYTIGDINKAVSTVNEAFDGCKQIVSCPVIVY